MNPDSIFHITSPLYTTAGSTETPSSTPGVMKVDCGGRLLHGDVLRDRRVFVAVRADGGGVWYGSLVLCFVGRHLGATKEFCYLRWMHTARAVAVACRREMTAEERRGPFARSTLIDGPGSPVTAPSATPGPTDRTAVLYAAP